MPVLLDILSHFRRMFPPIFIFLMDHCLAWPRIFHTRFCLNIVNPVWAPSLMMLPLGHSRYLLLLLMIIVVNYFCPPSHKYILARLRYGLGVYYFRHISTWLWLWLWLWLWPWLWLWLWLWMWLWLWLWLRKPKSDQAVGLMTYLPPGVSLFSINGCSKVCAAFLTSGLSFLGN